MSAVIYGPDGKPITQETYSIHPCRRNFVGLMGVTMNMGVVKKTPFLRSSYGNTLFVIPDYFRGVGKVYQYSIDIHFEWRNDGSWYGIMGFYSPAEIEHMRYYCSKTAHDSTVQLASMNQFNSGTSKNNLRDITGSGKHGKLVAEYDFVNGVAKFTCGEYTYTSNFNINHVVSGNRSGGIFGSIDYPNKTSLTPSSVTPSTQNSKLYGFVMKVDGVVVHDYIPTSKGCIHDKVTGDDVYPFQGYVEYGEEDETENEGDEEVDYGNNVFLYEYNYDYDLYEKTSIVCGTWSGDRESNFTITFLDEYGGGQAQFYYYGYWECYYDNGYIEEYGSELFSCNGYETNFIFGF